MNPQDQFCPNLEWAARGNVGAGNRTIHSQKRHRYQCQCCGKTFSETKGTALYRVKKEADLFILVLTLLVHGCPVQAIVAAFGLSDRPSLVAARTAHLQVQDRATALRPTQTTRS